MKRVCPICKNKTDLFSRHFQEPEPTNARKPEGWEKRLWNLGEAFALGKDTAPTDIPVNLVPFGLPTKSAILFGWKELKSFITHELADQRRELIESVPTKIDWYVDGPKKLSGEEPFRQRFYQLLQETFGKSGVHFEGDKTEKAWRDFGDFLSEVESVFSYFRNHGENLLSAEIKRWKEEKGKEII